MQIVIELVSADGKMKEEQKLLQVFHCLEEAGFTGTMLDNAHEIGNQANELTTESELTGSTKQICMQPFNRLEHTRWSGLLKLLSHPPHVIHPLKLFWSQQVANLLIDNTEMHVAMTQCNAMRKGMHV